MTSNATATPPVVSRAEWLAARRDHLAHEKELTRQSDKIHAERRRLPMVKLDKNYVFEGPEGKRSLLELFEGQKQLVMYHFMFDPAWEKACLGCSGFVDALGDLSMLKERNTNFVLISRAPLEKLEAWKEQRGWDTPWYSSFGSDFNYDFFVTMDKEKAPEQARAWIDSGYFKVPVDQPFPKGEQHGMSVFFRDGDSVFHTYSTFRRGVESVTDSYAMLDITPYGRQEDWEDSPDGFPQKPTYG